MELIVKNKITKNQQIDISQIIKMLLQTRDIKNEADFLNPKKISEYKFEDFFSLNEFKKLIQKLEELRRNGEMIVVYTDYDADGITGGAVMWETLHLLGFKVMPYVPERKTEGYGFSKVGIDKVNEKYHPKLIISVDHGIAAEEKVAYAKTLGIDIAVSDHHLKSDKGLVSSLATFHTEEMSGSGVAYFLAREIFSYFQKSTLKNSKELEKHFDQDYLALASIGTIADLVPLVGVARSLARYGMEAFLDIKRVGIKKLLDISGIENRKLNTFDIGFIVAPRINAIGRLEHAIDALRLLCTKNIDNANLLASKINDKNTERQDLVKVAVEEAFKMAESKLLNNPNLKIICLVSDNWNEGIIGLIAAKILDKYYRPAVMMTVSDDHAKGSVRSIVGFDITKFLREHKKYLIDVGGHKAAAGFSIEKNNIEKFILELEKSADKKISKNDLIKRIEVDIEIPISFLSKKLILEMEKFYPFGMGNPQPVFLTRGIIAKVQAMGKSNQHLRLEIQEMDSSNNFELVFFGEGEKIKELIIGKPIGVVYNPELNRWNGNEKIQGKGKLIIF